MHLARLIPVASLILSLPSASTALACGGTFCNPTPQTTLLPGQTPAVEQAAEIILFDIDLVAGTTTMVVEVAYTGDADAFAWVVPVADTPILSVVPQRALRLLAAGSAPRFTTAILSCTPAPTSRTRSSSRDSGCSFGCGMGDAPSASGAGWEEQADASESVVEVEDLPQVGPYDSVVVSSTDPTALRTWLVDNGFLITTEMEPLVDQYVADGMKFLAMKLAPGASVSSIQPIELVLPGTIPGIPLRLTAVGAAPELSILVFFLGDSEYAPSNWTGIDLDGGLLQPRWGTPSGTNYVPAVAKLLDELGGRAFLTERSQDAPAVLADVTAEVITPEDQAAMTYLEAIMTSDRWFTRLASRISGWEIVDDPVFAPTSPLINDGQYDLTARPLDGCLGSGQDPICGDTYCGVGAECAETNMGVDGCACAAGQVARAITMAGRPTVACVDESFDMFGSLSADPSMLAICNGVDCGAGACRVVSGFPTCACDPGHAAVALDGRRVLCSPLVQTYPPTQVDRPALVIAALVETESGGGCATLRQVARGDWALVILLLGVGSYRLRRRMGRRQVS